MYKGLYVTQYDVVFTGPRCLWGPVYGSRPLELQDLFETLQMLLWLMMIPTQYYWWCQYEANPGYSYSMIYMQVALVDGPSKIVGILEVKWKTNLFTRNMGIQNHFLSFVRHSNAIKMSKRAKHVNNVDSTCFCCWDDLSYGLNKSIPWIRCASGNVFLLNFKSSSAVSVRLSHLGLFCRSHWSV